MVEQKKGRGANCGTEPAVVKALRDEVERLKLRNAKLEAGCQTPQEKEVRLPTEVWAIIAGKIDKNDVCSFALVSKQLREAQVLAGRKLVTKLKRTRYFLHFPATSFNLSYFTEDWCAYWSRKFNVHHTDPDLIKRVLYVAACEGYLEVFEKYWSQGPRKKLRKLWDKNTIDWAALYGRLEVMKWLRAKGCPWDRYTSSKAADRGQLEVLQWMRGQDPPCPWNSDVCYEAASAGHLEVLRWARSQDCPCHQGVPYAAAQGGHLKVLRWLIKEGCPYDKSMCRAAAAEGGEHTREVLKWLDKGKGPKARDE